MHHEPLLARAHGRRCRPQNTAGAAADPDRCALANPAVRRGQEARFATAGAVAGVDCGGTGRFLLADVEQRRTGGGDRPAHEQLGSLPVGRGRQADAEAIASSSPACSSSTTGEFSVTSSKRDQEQADALKARQPNRVSRSDGGAHQNFPPKNRPPPVAGCARREFQARPVLRRYDVLRQRRLRGARRATGRAFNGSSNSSNLPGLTEDSRQRIFDEVVRRKAAQHAGNDETGVSADREPFAPRGALVRALQAAVLAVASSADRTSGSTPNPT